MKFAFFRKITLLGLLVPAFPLPAEAASKAGIHELPRLSQLLFHHFECTMQIVLNGPEGSKEGKFMVQPRGGENSQGDATLTLGADELKVGANAQMIEMQWSRGGKPLALTEMMVQRSPTPAFVLIALDPTNFNNQASVNCVAVTFAELKASTALNKGKR